MKPLKNLSSWFMVVAMLFIIYPHRVHGYEKEIADFNKGLGFVKYHWQGYSPPKNKGIGVKRTYRRTGQDGETLFGQESEADNKFIIHNKVHPTEPGEVIFEKKTYSDKDILLGKGIKVLYGRVYGTLSFWPSNF